MGSEDRQRESIDDLDALLTSLPPEIVAAVHALPDRTELIEVVMDLGRRPEARFPDSEIGLLDRWMGKLVLLGIVAGGTGQGCIGVEAVSGGVQGGQV